MRLARLTGNWGRQLMRDYGKVHTSFWSSPTITSMSEDGRMLAMYLITSPHSTIAGVFRLPDGYVCEDLKWSSERVSKGFSELFAKGYANRCETTKWVWVCKHLEWNKPENPNQCKSAAKIALAVPDECLWKLDFMRVSSHLLGIQWTEPAKPSGTVPQPFLNQKQEQEQEQEQKQEIQGAIAPLSPAVPTTDVLPGLEDMAEQPSIPACPVKQLVDLYHVKLPTLTKHRYELWKESAGAEALRQRWKWLLHPDTRREDKTRYATTASEALEWFSLFFEKVSESDFLSGRNGVWPKCDLTWLMKRENFMKVVQGNYENKGAQ